MKSALLLTLLCLAGMSLLAQPEITVIATGLRAPVGIDPDGRGNYLVVQRGTGQGDGEVSLMRQDGQIEPLVVGLPSRFDTIRQEVAGPLRAQMLQDPYFVVFCPFLEDEEHPLALLFNLDAWAPGLPFTPADALQAFSIGDFVYGSGFDNSNPYSMVHDGCNWYVADAGANAILKRSGLTGEMSVVAQFPDFPNPAPFGPPFIDVVPTRILANPTGGFFVSSLTGFPFVPGASAIWYVDEENGAIAVDTGYSLVTDMVVHPDEDGLLSLQFAEFDGTAMPPFVFGSSIIVHTNLDLERDTIVSGFGPSAGMALGEDDIIFVTELFTGRVLRIDPNTTAVNPDVEIGLDGLMAYPNPTSDLLSLSFRLHRGDQITLKAFDMNGRQLATRSLGFRATGTHQETISLASWLPAAVAGQNLYLRVEGNAGWSADRLVVVIR